jgi:hypothetical protein
MMNDTKVLIVGYVDEIIAAIDEEKKLTDKIMNIAKNNYIQI